ncbi:MAG: hypothetical protein KDE63_08090 [Novosphingobium sp.]|nr:hypothetical protein [Novosphingobium sp.]
MSAVPAQADVYGDNLVELAEQVRDFALDSFGRARREARNPTRQAVFVKQALALSKGYASLVAAMDRHRKALREED